MSRPEALAVVRGTCESIAEQRGLEVVEVSLLGSGGRRMLRVILDKPDQVLTLNEIADVSEEISRSLDIDDPIEGSYTLEVSSAGLERPLTRPEHYTRFAGREVKVRVSEPIEGQRNFIGTIKHSGNETFVLELTEGGVVEIPYSAVARANLTVDWDAELKGIDAGGHS